MNDLFPLISFGDLPVSHFVLAMGAVVAAYTVFSLVGFGSALMASGPLAMIMPVARVVPMLAIMDFGGSVWRGWRARHDVAWVELRRLLSGMLGGQLLGVLVLTHLPTPLMAVGLGFFVASQGARGLVKGGDKANRSAFPAFAYGLFGGTLGGLFGSGGFVYASYLERRLKNRAAFRATQAVLIALSTGWRVVLAVAVGLLDFELLVTACLFLPAMLAGSMLGQHIDLRISRECLFQVLNGLLIVSGVSLIIRFLG